MNTFLKDILDQPAVLQEVLTAMLTQNRTQMEQAARLVAGAQRLVLTSMGSAYYSLMPMAYALSYLRPGVHLVETSELFNKPFFPHTLYVIMSRSGESGEIAAFAQVLRQRGEALLAITMTPESTLARNASLVVHDPAPYDGFICTKAYTSLALVGLLIASLIEGGLTAELVRALRATFEWMEAHKLCLLDELRRLPWLGNSLTFLSRRAGLGLAMSGSLWLEEAARVRAAYSSIDMFLHGPLEQVDEHFCGVWIDLLSPAEDERSKRQFRQFSEKGGRLMTIGLEGCYDQGILVAGIDLPEAYRILPAALPVQLLAYQSAANLGLEAGEMRYLDWVVK